MSVWATSFTIGTFFFLGWWLAHEYYESPTPSTPTLYSYLWILAIPVTWAWFLLVATPAYLLARPTFFLVSLTALALLCATSLPFHPDGVSLTLSITMASVAVMLFVLTHPVVAARWRSGTLCVQYTPRTLSEFDALPSSVCVVAEGWSFWLGWRRAHAPVVRVGQNWAGLDAWCSDTRVRVRAGTTFGQLRRILATRRCAIVDRSQFDGLTVGGAVASRSHGWNSRYTFVTDVVAEALTMRDGTLRRAHRGDVIVYVTLYVVPDNTVRLTRTGREDLWPLLWHRLPTFRMLLVNAHGVVLTTGEMMEASLPCSTRQWIDRRSHAVWLCGCHSKSTHHTVRPLSMVHSVFHTIWPMEAIAMRALGYRNAELFLDEVLDDVPTLVECLKRVHCTLGGHTELRERPDGTLAVDVAIPWLRSCDPIWNVLYEAGARHAHLHPGKWTPHSIAPLVLRNTQRAQRASSAIRSHGV